jgi:hypothetical protein
MAIFIQQDPEEVKQSFSVQRRAEIVDVRLRSASVDSPQETAASTEKMSIDISFDPTVGVCEDGRLSTHIDFAVAASPENDDAVRIFGIKCSFRVTYQLEEGFQPTAQEAKAFASANAVFNVWPYFREFAQSTCSRLGFSSAPAIPFLKLVPKPEEKPASKSDANVTATSPSSSD